MKYIGDIKSKYNIKEVFSFLSEKQKLNMIIYNKEIQYILGIDIEDYKKASGRYIIYGINGEVKEYKINTNKLLFEGEYLNKKRNGKGKEYLENGELIYEGEYLNGKKNGKGKEYYFNGQFIHEGEFLNGERNGQGKDYYNNELIFEGEYLKGEKNGKGKEYRYGELNL